MKDELDIVRYCDVFKCEDCPRRGDDCDGIDDKTEMQNLRSGDE